MFVLGKKGEQWSVDDLLQEKAMKLVNEFDMDLGHVEVDKVIFVRVTGLGTKANWAGKCFPVKIPNNILPRYLVSKFVKLGIIKKEDIPLIEDNFLDIRYIIALNGDKIESMSQNGPKDADRLEDITLMHELMHIPLDMEGTNKHDCEDFKFILEKFGTRWCEGILEEQDNSPEEYDYEVKVTYGE
jgi:hypothetical protein